MNLQQWHCEVESASLTSSWSDWPPKEEWPEVATSGQLPASLGFGQCLPPASLLAPVSASKFPRPPVH